MKKIILSFILGLIINSTAAQKIERAFTALEENKIDKAIQLFEELIEKDNRDIVATIGLTRARDKKNPTRSNKAELIESIDRLISQSPYFDFYTESDKMYFKIRLNIGKREDIDYIIKNLVEDLWFKHVTYTNNIEEAEAFKSKYSFYYPVNFSSVDQKIIDLYYSKALLINTIQEYENFLFKYPKTKYTDLVKEEIDNLVFKKASESNNILELETYIKLYKLSTNFGNASVQISNLYLKSVKESNNINLLENILQKFNLLKNVTIVQNNRSKLETSLSNLYINSIMESSNLNQIEKIKADLINLKYADSLDIKISRINKKLYNIEYDNILTKSNHNELNEFLFKHEEYKSNHLNLYDKRDSLWLISIEPFTSNKIQEYIDFFKFATYNKKYSNLLDNIKNDWIQKIKIKIASNLNEYLKTETSSLSSIINIQDLIFLDSNLIKFKIDHEYILNFVKNNNINDLLQNLLDENRLDLKTLYYSYNIDENIFRYVTFNSDAATRKDALYLGLGVGNNINRFNYYIKNNKLVQSPIFLTNDKIFNAIKLKYNVVKFSKSRLAEYYPNTDEFRVSFYGFTLMNLKSGNCCPSYMIDILFTKLGSNYIPKTAISIINNYTNIENEDNNADYIIRGNYLLDLREILNWSIENSKMDIFGSTNIDGTIDTFNQVAEQSEMPLEIETDKIYTVVQIPAEFPGGQQGWVRYLERNLNIDLPVQNGAPAGKYSVVISFIVARDGSISDVKSENDPGYGTKDEAVRVITRGPKWKPAVQNGRNVIYRHRQAIVFAVT
jgi:hypothetical protein